MNESPFFPLIKFQADRKTYQMLILQDLEANWLVLRLGVEQKAGGGIDRFLALSLRFEPRKVKPNFLLKIMQN